jgi:hypothetical protein
MADSLFAKVKQARDAGYSDGEILQFLTQQGLADPGQVQQALDNDYKPSEVLGFLAKREPRSTGSKVLDSPIGGFVRGLRDIPDAGAQLITRGLEAIAPAGSGFETWARGQRENVENINREAERDYRDNWRRGSVDDSFDAGRLVGNIAGTLPAAALTGPIGPGIAAGTLAARGAVQGGAAGLMTPVENPDDNFFTEKAVQFGIGAGGGAAGGVAAPKIASIIQGGARSGQATAQATGGGSTLGRVGPDPSSGLTETQQRLIQRGNELGFRTTPGQASGSRALQQMEARMESNPFFSGPFNTIKNTNQKQLNRYAANAIGETSDVLDSAVLGRAEARLGQVFDDTASAIPRANVAADDVVSKLAGVEGEFSGLLPKPLAEYGLVSRFLDQVAAGDMTGAQLRNLSSQFGRAGKNAMTSQSGDRELGQAYFAVKEIVDDLIAQNLDDATRGAYNAAREQYRNLMLLTTRPNVVNPSSGNVSGANLSAALQAKDKGGFLFGRNQSDFYDAARFAQAFKPIVGDSGTATRSMEITPMSMLLSLPTRVGAGMYTSRPASALAAGAGRGVAPNRAGDAAAAAVRRALPVSAGAGLLDYIER